MASPLSFDDPVTVEIVSQTSGYTAGLQDMVQQTQQASAGVKRSIDTLGQSAKDFMALGREVDSLLAAEVKTLSDITQRQQTYNAAVRAGVMTQAEHAAALSAMQKVEQQLLAARQKNTAETKTATAATHQFSLATAGAQRELGVLAGELLRSNMVAFERSSITLARQTGLLQMAFSGAGLAIAGTLAVAGGIIKTYADAEHELDDFNRTLLLTGNYAGKTSEELVAMRNEIGAATGDYSGASDALKELAGSGRLSGEALELAARGAVEFAELSGESADKAAKAYEAIFKDPLRMADELNQAYHFLTQEQYEHINQLVKEGEKTQAATELTKLFTEALDKRFAQYREEQGWIAKGWDGIKESIGGAYAEAKGFFQGMANFSVDGFWNKLKGQAMSAAFGGNQPNFSELFSNVDAGAKTAQAAADSLTAHINELGIEGDKSIQKIIDQYGKSATAADKLKEVQHQLYEAYLAGGKLPKGISFDLNGPDPEKASGPMWDQIAAKILNTGKASREAAADMRAINSVMSSLNNDITKGISVADQLATEYTGPLASANRAYQKQLETLTTALDALNAKAAVDPKFAASPEYLQQLGKLNLAVIQAGDAFDLAKQKAEAFALVQEQTGDSVERLFLSYQKETEGIWLSDEARKAMDENLKIEKEVRQAVLQAIKDGHPEYAEHYDELVQQAQAQAEVRRAMEKSVAEIKTYLSIMENGANDVLHEFTNNLVGAGDGWDNFGKHLKNSAKQMVADLLFEFLKLRVLGPFLQSLFGGSFGGAGGGGWGSLIPAGIALATGSGGSSGGGSGTVGTIVNSFTGGGTGSGGWADMLGGNNTWYSAGKYLWNGFQNGWGASPAGSSIFGTWSGNTTGGIGPYAPTAGGSQLGLVPDYGAGAPGSVGVVGQPGTYTPSALGYGVAIAGGVYAGYNRWQNSNKDFGGALGAAAYGVGTYSAAIGTGAALSGGMAAGMAAIPVIGWIALAAMLVDMISGGKLFGTSANKFKDASQTLNVGADGASFSNELQLTGQRAFFGGRYTRTSHPDETPEQAAAAQKFYDELLKQSTSFAKQFGMTVGEVASGSFTQHFDKKGKPIDGKTTTVIGGHTFEGETQEQFGTRILAESFKLDIKQLGVDISDYTDAFIDDADKYAQAVQDAAQAVAMAQQDIKQGMDLSGTGTLAGAWEMTQKYNDDGEGPAATYSRLHKEMQDVKDGIGLLTGQDTIEDIEAFIRENQMFGESVSQTYQRMQSASQAYRSTVQSVNQGIQDLTSGGDPVAQFINSIYGISEAEKNTTKQLNDAAIAAGLQGASEEDLARVHKLAALQAQQAIMGLQSAGASLVDSLYGTGTLGGINSTIQAIMSAYGVDENGVSTATSALGGFSGAIHSVAQAAVDAMQLMLGSLSPYNDEEKLQLAMQGLRAGTASREDVLGVAQRLYASSNKYRDIYNEVMSIPDRTKDTGDSGGGGGGGGVSTSRDLSGTHGMTPADLKDLIEQREKLEAQQRMLQVNQLASVVAQLSTAQTLSYEDVAKELNFNLEDMAKDLGVKLEDLPAFLDNLKDQQNKVPDTIVGQTDRLVDMLARIFTALTGETIDTTGGDTSVTPPGGAHSTHAGPGGAPPSASPGAGRTRSAQPVPSQGGGAPPSKAGTSDSTTLTEMNEGIKRLVAIWGRIEQAGPRNARVRVN